MTVSAALSDPPNAFAINSGLPYQCNRSRTCYVACGLLEIGIWKEGVYSTLGWVQYDDWGNVMQLAVPDVNSLITVEQLQQFLASGPSFQ